MCLIAFGNGDGRNLRVVETERASALLTMEVWMLVVVVVVPMTVAELVAQAIAILDDMHEVLFSEEREGTEDVRLVDGRNLMLQLCQRLWQHGGTEGSHHDNPVGGGLDIMLFKQSDTVFFFHHGCKGTLFL